MLPCQFALLTLNCEDKQNKGQMPSNLFKTTKYSMNRNIIFVILLNLAIDLIYEYRKHIIIVEVIAFTMVY